MSGDNEHEPGDAGDGPAPDSAVSKAEEAGFQPRRFRGWESARVEGKRPSILKRVASLFRGSEQPEIAPSASVESSAPDNTVPLAFDPSTFDGPAALSTEADAFSSVEDALPAPEAPPQPPFATAEGEQGSPKDGLFSRMFRRSKSTPRPSLEIEVHEDRISAAAGAPDHEDRISAAADALNEVGEQTFAERREAPESLDDIFASVEEALPGDERRFPPPPPPPPPLDPLDDLDLVIEKEVKFPTRAPAPQPEAAPYFGDTLDPVVIEPPDAALDADTDEFEVIAPVAPPIPPGVDEDTARVSQKTLIESLLFWRNKKDAEGGIGSTVVEAPPAFLFSKFRTFYNEIIRFKHQKTEFTAGFSTAIVTDYTADISPDNAAETLSKNLAAMLELQAAEAMWMGGESAERYPDAQYAMAALADEIFTHMEWDGQIAWPRSLLEVKLFKTHCAEVELFRRIDRLLKDQPDSAAARDLARVYLLVIAAGFKGKYRPFGLTRALAEYRQRLYEYIHGGNDALLIYDPDRRIFPEAAQRTLVGEAVAKYTGAQRWAAILAFLILGYTAIAHVAWSRVSADLRDVTDRIRAGSTANGNP